MKEFKGSKKEYRGFKVALIINFVRFHSILERVLIIYNLGKKGAQKIVCGDQEGVHVVQGCLKVNHISPWPI